MAEEHQTHPPEDHAADCLDCAVQGHLDLDDSATHPSLSVKNVVSVLISSEFLQMNNLVDDCLRFEASMGCKSSSYASTAFQGSSAFPSPFFPPAFVMRTWRAS